MTGYLIEFRFQGRAKKEMKRLIWEVDKKFNLRRARKIRPVPHITIIAPFSTNNQRRLVKDFNDVCKKYNLIKFNIDSYGCFENSKVVYVDIKPSKQLIDFRSDLLNKLKKYCKLTATDVFSLLGIIKVNKKYHPHATIAMKLTDSKFKEIKDYVYRKKEPSRKYILVRATLIKNKKILYEYDFLLKRLLNRRQAKSKRIYSKTLAKLK